MVDGVVDGQLSGRGLRPGEQPSELRI